MSNDSSPTPYSSSEMRQSLLDAARDVADYIEQLETQLHDAHQRIALLERERSDVH